MKKSEKKQREYNKKILYKRLQEMQEKYGRAYGAVIYEKAFGLFTSVVADGPVLEYVIADPTGFFFENYKKLFRILYPVGAKFEITEAKHDKYSLFTTLYLK